MKTSVSSKFFIFIAFEKSFLFKINSLGCNVFLIFQINSNDLLIPHSCSNKYHRVSNFYFVLLQLYKLFKFIKIYFYLINLKRYFKTSNPYYSTLKFHQSIVFIIPFVEQDCKNKMSLFLKIYFLNKDFVSSQFRPY